MIYLTKGQPLFDNAGMVVSSPSGYYNDGDSVVCAMYHMPDEPVCLYEAKFVAYGNTVYEITDQEKLMEEVLKIDPASLFGKNNDEVAMDRMVDNIKTVETVPEKTENVQSSSLETPSVDNSGNPGNSDGSDESILVYKPTNPPIEELPLDVPPAEQVVSVSDATSTVPSIGEVVDSANDVAIQVNDLVE